MCGIAGILSKQLDQSDVSQRIAAMQASLRHRGPDDQGLFQSELSASALAHTRLSIIDLSSGGHQPMTVANRRYWITFNGEIYNYRALRSTLEQQGAVFTSQSDTEVILQLYQRMGEECITQLRGMFAFLIWDETEQQAFAARDPLGIKPFYYLASDQTFAFASEVRTLLQSGLSQRALGENGLKSYLRHGTVSEPATLVDDINMLGAGHTLSWKNGVLNINQYWSLSFKANNIDRADAVRLTRSALEDSIRAHFVSDVPVGIFLSGGVDSTALVALAKKISEKPVNTYSIAFEDPAWNEGPVARRVAEYFGTNHTELIMTPDKARELFETFLDDIDQPTIDGFNTYCVAKLAHDHGEKVVLSGLGADELFAGYKSFQIIPKMLRTAKLLVVLLPLLKVIRTPLDRSLSARFRRVLDFLVNPTVKQAHQSLRGMFSRSETSALIQALGLSQQGLSDGTNISTQNVADRISELEITTYMRNQLLRDSDIMSMAWGLELRVPFVDQKLFETVCMIPSDLRLQYGKQLLIDAVPEIPEWVINRPKQGFRFPFDQWFASDWQAVPNPIKTPHWIKLTPWYRRWSLLVLDHWMKRNLSTGQH